MRALMLLVVVLAGCSDPSLDASPACLAVLPSAPFPIDADGPDTQIHASSALGDDTLWVTWNGPSAQAGGGFAVNLVGLGCDGIPRFGPLVVSDQGQVEIDPSVAVSGDRVLVTWMNDTGVGPANLRARARTYSADGEPVGPARDLALRRAGAPIPGNVIGPVAVGAPEGFVLVGSWGHDDAPAFQAFSAVLDRDGEPVGDAVDVALEPSRGQTAVRASIDPDGATHVAWEEDALGEGDPVVTVAVLGDEAERVAAPGARPSISTRFDDPWLAYDDDNGTVFVRRGAREPFALALGGFAHSVSIQGSALGFVVLWLDQSQGIYNRVHVGRFTPSGTEIGRVSLDTDEVPAVYPLDLVRLDESRYLVVWQEGVSPAFRVFARVVEI